MASKKNGKTAITNTSEQSYALPDGTMIPAGETVVVTNEVWAAAEENETVAAWVESGDLETAPADTSAEDAAVEEEEKRKAKEKADREKADRDRQSKEAASKKTDR